MYTKNDIKENTTDIVYENEETRKREGRLCDSDHVPALWHEEGREGKTTNESGFRKKRGKNKSKQAVSDPGQSGFAWDPVPPHHMEGHRFRFPLRTERRPLPTRHPWRFPLTHRRAPPTRQRQPEPGSAGDEPIPGCRLWFRLDQSWTPSSSTSTSSISTSRSENITLEFCFGTVTCERGWTGELARGGGGENTWRRRGCAGHVFRLVLVFDVDVLVDVCEAAAEREGKGGSMLIEEWAYAFVVKRVRTGCDETDGDRKKT
ncbi:hypothetical protein OG21DRAFT_1604764 [Imleria badia]|nr:hypothetical protein OG21DRAFT_1604764 [Imleria badia]